MGFGHPEYGHDRIADELFDEPVIAFYDPGDFTENQVHDLPDFLRIESFGHGRVAGEIREHDGGVFAFAFGRKRGRRQARHLCQMAGAFIAESGVFRVLALALRAFHG